MRFIISVFTTLVVVSTSVAQITISTANLDISEYHEKLLQIVSTQIIDHKTVTERKEWDWLKPELTKPVAITRRVAIHGKELWVSRDTTQSPAQEGQFAHVITPDAAYLIHKKSDAGKYTLIGHDTEWKNQQSYLNSIRLFSACKQLFQPNQVKEVLDTSNDVYEGRQTKRITIQTNYGAKLTAHIDRKTYQHIYSEEDKIPDMKAHSYIDGKMIRKTEYRSEGGRLWPTRHEDYMIKSDGKKQPMYEITFLEYAPYTPSADELNIEKQFGIKPIPHEARPASAMVKKSSVRPSYWWYLAGGVFLAFTVGLVLFARKRRATS